MSEGGVEWGSQVDQKWVEIQKKTFTRWANTFLKERMMKIDDLETDLSDGLLLINLLEIISSKSVGKFNKAPKIRTQKLENNSFALKFLQSEGIKLVNIGNEDIVDSKLKLILGLIWTIILRYQIHIEEGKSARSDLLKWVQQQIPEYNIKNFSSNWNDGKAICALADSLMPGICPNHMALDPNAPLYNAELGCGVAEEKLNIPKVLDPRDMINPNVDELSVMTYISYYRDWAANEAKRRGQEELERLAVPGRCRAYGPGLEKGETHIPTEFTIEAINQFMRRVNHGGDPFEVSIAGPRTPVQFNMTDNNDGTYRVEYTPVEVGVHIVTITLKATQIQGSPFRVPVSRTPPDAQHCKAWGPGLEGGIAGEPAPFTIASFNRLGQPLKDGGDKFEVKVKGPYDVDVPVDFKDNNDGTYSVKYHPNDAGEHVVNVTLRGEPLPGSPFHVGIAEPLDAASAINCVAYGPGLEGGKTSEPSVFTVEVRNSRGDKLTKGGAPIDVDVSDANGVEIPAKVVDNNNGTFTVTYQPQDNGTYKVDVVLRHKQIPLFYTHIKDSPFHVNVEAGTDANKSLAYGPGLEDGVTDQLPTHFTVESRDKHGNRMPTGGDPFEVKVQGPNGPVPATIKDNGDGTYKVDYKPNDAGKHRIDVTLKGQPVAKSPYTVNVKEGADNSTSVIENYTFVIQAKNKKGANKTSGGDDFKVVVHGPAGKVPVEVKDLNNGQYLVSYKLTQRGDYAIEVTLNGQPLTGYPNGLKVAY
eukprot:TRINITY_DN369_c0_g1_i1.p1 TRINITY_DN369_c0_g1~~TRINITY_DN369_c0_g1_i1.p1  ORF type:complete len:755 (+),score=260.59 TRINITY_DN369_c0_g1_i1:68-2332(+)